MLSALKQQGILTNYYQRKIILLIDDDLDMQKYTVTVLMGGQYQVFCASNGQESLCELYRRKPDLVLLDARLPGIDGMKICQQIRQLSDIPIIFLIVLGDEASIIQGLDCGANDYLVKLISGPLLLARIRAALRSSTQSINPEKSLAYADDYLMIDVTMRQVLVRGQPVSLTATELRLLAYLLQHVGKVLTPMVL